MNQPALPIIDLSSLSRGTAPDSALITTMRQAVVERGFMYVVGHGIEAALLARAFAAAREFFALPRAAKDQYAYTDIDANFGFQGIELESLDPGNAPDLKEAFTMRNALALGAQARRWPNAAFREVALQLYAEGLHAAYRILSVLALGLDLPADFFMAYHRGENVTLRFLHYPANLARRASAQLGAGAHTDYGSITLLFQDEVGGLELRDADDNWRSAPPVAQAAVVNTGDLLQRWTNDCFRSTLHRVRPISGAQDRYSIALFVDPDSAVSVECIPSCISATRPARYACITAGEHIQQKIAATQPIAGDPP